MMNGKTYTYIGLAGIALVFSLMYMFQNTLSTVEGVEWCEAPVTIEETISTYKKAVSEEKMKHSQQEFIIRKAKEKQAESKRLATLYRSIIADSISGTHEDLLAIGFQKPK